MRKAIVLLFMAAVCAVAADDDAIVRGFRNPPQKAHVHCYWWWLNGNTDKAAITRDLEQMKANGYGGALLVDANGSNQNGNEMVPAGPMFGTAEWRELYRHAVKEAARLDLEISLNITSGWNLGGPTIRPEQASKILTFSRIVVDGGKPADIQLPEPARKNGFYRDIATLAYPLRHGEVLPEPIERLPEKAAFKEFGRSMPLTKPLLEDIPPTPGEQDALAGEVVDVTKRAMNGRLQWTPPGQPKWEILRIGYTDSGAVVSTSSGKWQGLALDYLDHTALESYFQQQVEPLLQDAGPYLGKSLRYLVTDSWELGGTNWTSKFRDEFRSRRGYDLLPYLPIVAGRIIDDRKTSNRFLNDFRKTIGELIADEHYGTFARLAEKHGLGIHPESGGPHGAPIDALRTLGKSTFPQTEFWAQSPTHRSTDADRFFVKEGSSAAHIYGKTLVAAEGMTTIGPQWEETIWNDLKPTFDQAICSGLNLIFWHTFTSSPKSAGLPGQEYFAGTHLNPNVTWWPYAGPFLRYISRIQFMMQQGWPVADVLYYYGDNVPNFVQLKAADPAAVLPGYDYDVIDEEALLQRLDCKDGRLVLPDGMSYRVLVLPNLPTLSAAAAAKISVLQEKGAVIVGAKPKEPTGLHQNIQTIVDKMWSNCASCGDSTRHRLEALKVKPDFSSDSKDLDYEHRHAANADIYFIRSRSSESIHADIRLRISGSAPEEWDAARGSITPLYLYREDSGITTMPLMLGPYGSTMIVFKPGQRKHWTRWPGQPLTVTRQAGAWKIQSENAGDYRLDDETGRTATFHLDAPPEPIHLDGPWQVAFAPGWGAPASIAFDRLRSWTEDSDPAIKYFSGSATYTKSFQVPPSVANAHSVLLDLGEIRELARVTLNGQDLGIVWQHPATLDVAGHLRAGENQVSISVVNLWPNRLIGDQALPAEKRLTHTNILKFKADSPLTPSGLLGPVQIRVMAGN